MTTSGEGRHRERHDPHWIEWLTGIVSAILVAAMLGWLGWEAFARQSTRPDFTITVLATEKAATGYRITFDIANSGTTTAAAVTVIGRLRVDGRVLEEVPVTFDYVAAESTTTGAVLFQNNPEGGTLTIEPAGYTAP